MFVRLQKAQGELECGYDIRLPFKFRSAQPFDEAAARPFQYQAASSFMTVQIST